MLDEIQLRPELFPTLRVLADRDGTPARFLLLGSASRDLLRQGSESLAGRMAVTHLDGFAIREVLAADVSKLWRRGGFRRSFLSADETSSYAGREPNPDHLRFWEPEIPFPRCADLAVAQREVDRRLVAVCVGLSEAECARPIAVPRRAGVLYEPAVRLLSHLFQHQIHHRGQAHAMLAGTDVAPPQLDEFFCANEAHLRAAELTDLGYTEALIWG